MLRSNFRVLIAVSSIILVCFSVLGQHALCLGQVAEAKPGVSDEPAKKVVTKIHNLNPAIEAHARSTSRTVDEAKLDAVLQLFGLPAGKKHLKRYEIRPGLFEVTASESFHEHLTGMAKWMVDGEKQITIEARIVTVSEQSLRKLQTRFASEWEMAAEANHLLHSKSENSPQPEQCAIDFGSLSRSTVPVDEVVSASTRVTKNLPCRVAKINDEQLKSVLADSQADTGTNLMQAPKVTIFPGQQAVVKDTTQRPFVTSVKRITNEQGTALQPIITILEEGISMQIRVSHSEGERMQIDSNVTMGEIRDVDEFTFESGGEDAGTTVQIPELLERVVRVSSALNDGQSLLIDPHFSKEKTVKRRFRRAVTTREFTVVILTPRIITPQPGADVAKVANL